jgi:hypothetical protein
MTAWSLGCPLMTGGDNTVSSAFELATVPAALDTISA